MTPSNWSMNGPGCCCPTSPHSVHPCACYSFDNTPNNSSWNGLHLTAHAPAYTTTKKLGTHAGQFSGYANYEHPHADCFTPAGGSKPWRLWFWFRCETEPSDSLGAYQGVITKGEVSYSYPSTTFEGEWGVFYKPQPGSGGSDLWFIYKSSTVTMGIFGAAIIVPGEWYFCFWQINTTTKAAELQVIAPNGNDISTGAAAVATPTAIAGDMQEEPTFPMRIGRNTGSAGLILGENSGSFQIDNVGFSEDSGTASTLYNSGTGLACPSR